MLAQHRCCEMYICSFGTAAYNDVNCRSAGCGGDGMRTTAGVRRRWRCWLHFCGRQLLVSWGRPQNGMSTEWCVVVANVTSSSPQPTGAQTHSRSTGCMGLHVTLPAVTHANTAHMRIGTSTHRRNKTLDLPATTLQGPAGCSSAWRSCLPGSRTSWRWRCRPQRRSSAGRAAQSSQSPQHHGSRCSLIAALNKS